MLFDILGVKTPDTINWLTWHEKILEGFPAIALHKMAKALDVTPVDVAHLVGLDEDAAAWQERGAHLPTTASNTLYRIALAYQRVFLVVKEETAAAAWLRNPQKEANGFAPILLLLSHTGANDVYAAIERFKAIQKLKDEQKVLPSEDEDFRPEGEEEGEAMPDEEPPLDE